MFKHFFMIPAVCFLPMLTFAVYGDLIPDYDPAQDLIKRAIQTVNNRGSGDVVYGDDVIEEPENDFYKLHQNQIIRLGRSFTANGKNGSVPVKKEPGLKTTDAKIQNGEVTYIRYSCFYNKRFWGFTPEYNGWVRMGEMLVMYDYVAFEEDHRNKFYNPRNYADAEIKRNRAAVAWPWPGADAYLWIFKDLDMRNINITHAYNDNYGRQWGFAAYYNIWICLSDPLNLDIPAFNPAPKPEVWMPKTAPVDVKRSVDQAVTLIAVLVAALVTGTVVLINVFWKPNKTKAGVRNYD